MQGLEAKTRYNAYTLTEVLAVVVLIGLVAAVFVPSLARASNSSQLARLKADLIQLDVSARQLALQGNAISMRWEPEAHRMRLFVRQTEPQELLSLMVPEQFKFEPVGFETAVKFDALGQSQSYGYQILSESGAHLVDFNGQSGWYEVYSGVQ